MIDGFPEITGIAEEISVRENIEIIERFKLQVNEVLVLGTSETNSEKLNLTQTTDFIENYKDSLYFTVLDQSNHSDINSYLENPESSQAILLTGFIKDRSGKIGDFEETVNEIKKLTNAPVFTYWRDSLGSGIVGGHLISSWNQGYLAATIAVSVLNGVSLSDIPVIGSEANE